MDWEGESALLTHGISEDEKFLRTVELGRKVGRMTARLGIGPFPWSWAESSSVSLSTHPPTPCHPFYAIHPPTGHHLVVPKV